MGRVTLPVRIENLEDLLLVDRGVVAADGVRSVEVPDALVDTGATMLSLPRRLIEPLGLRRVRTRTARTSAGVFEFGIYQAVRLTVQGRDCVIEVAEVPDSCPALIGQVPLELLDWVVDPVHQRLIGSPDHDGEPMMDMF